MTKTKSFVQNYVFKSFVDNDILKSPVDDDFTALA